MNSILSLKRYVWYISWYEYVVEGIRWKFFSKRLSVVFYNRLSKLSMAGINTDTNTQATVRPTWGFLVAKAQCGDGYLILGLILRIKRLLLLKLKSYTGNTMTLYIAFLAS